MPSLTIDPQESIRLLAHQIKTGEKLLSQPQIGKGPYGSWQFENMKALHQCFGENSPEVLRFKPAGPGQRMIANDAPEKTWEKLRRGWVEVRISLLQGYILALAKMTTVPADILPADRASPAAPDPFRLFISYSHKDEVFREELTRHLSLLIHQGLISPWQDLCILAGDEWNQQINQNLEAAHICILLISSDFISSKYCFHVEMKQAVKRHNEGTARVVPVIVRPCDWHAAPFGKLQALPKDGKAITSWPNRDEAWLNVAQGIRRIVEELRPTVCQ